MTTYYCDCDLTTGNNDGTTQANAWQTLQRAIDGTDGTQPTAGDTVLCKGTDSISAAIDMDGGSGTYNGGYLKFVGVNASWVNDGTYFVIDGGSNTIDGIYHSQTKPFIWLENIKIQHCDGTAGINSAAAYADEWIFNNVWVYSCDGHGMSGLYFRYTKFFRCRFTDNTGDGVYRFGLNPRFHYCEFMGNTGDGIDIYSASSVFNGCIFHNNGAWGVDSISLADFINCIFDSNASGGFKIAGSADEAPTFIGCRVTNHSGAGDVGVSIAGTAERSQFVGCYFGNNTTAITADRYDVIPIAGSTSHVVLNGSETDHGYTTPASDDFNLDPDKAVNTYSIAIPLD